MLMLCMALSPSDILAAAAAAVLHTRCVSLPKAKDVTYPQLN